MRTHLIPVNPQYSQLLYHPKVYILATMAVVVHSERDMLPWSFGNQGMNKQSLQSIDTSRARRSFYTQVQLSFRGPYGQLLVCHVLVVEWSFWDPRYPEPIAFLYTKGLHLLLWHLHLPFLSIHCCMSWANPRYLGQIRSHPSTSLDEICQQEWPWMSQTKR